MKLIGKGWGGHLLCENLLPKPGTPCAFLSYGIASDWSFDSALSQVTGCRGFLFDPTVNHKAQPEINLWFGAFAAPMLHGTAGWVELSPPRAMAAFVRQGDRVPVLKMDCEGGEYAVADAIIRQDRHMLQRVSQVALEVHTGIKWCKGHAEVVGLARLFWLMNEAGMSFIRAHIGDCAHTDEMAGYNQELVDHGIPSARGKCCQEWLFARVEK